MDNEADFKDVAVAFAAALVHRDYAAAHAMTSKAYQAATTVDALRSAFEAIVPTDWPPSSPVDIGMTMEDWPGKEPHDVGWAYVGIGADVYSEAITVVVVAEDSELKIRTVEFGRP